MNMSEEKCTEYSSEGEDSTPCQCPKCKGFLKWIWKEGEGMQPVCNKCRTPLIAIPHKDSDDSCEWGKICVLKPFTDLTKTGDAK
jgi:hypothetical protein